MPNVSTNSSGTAQYPAVPQLISTKDAQYLKDQMAWLLLAAKKCGHFANESQDPEVRQTLQQIAKMHERHYTQLLGHLNIQNSQISQAASTMSQTQSTATPLQNTTRQ